VNIDIELGPKDPELLERMRERVEKAVSKLTTPPVRVLINFEDVNGPKGGVDTRCGITLRIPGRRLLHVEELAANAWLAFTGASEALDRSVQKQTERETTRRRRPKKYYVAKRMLLPEVGRLAPDGPTSDQRRQSAREGSR
jgi:ribosome-associated translation inhibitor RaiA